ncbi:hypothetical protein FNV43_RR27359 [Rhamnella rubrinervis]|uniref:Chitobiosyldiphosphodolichol beta-mannosyltransferase n=1 Tax=Rhamnella rubrinervis TaxID=2594499 RepID=A0A8K0DR45_9ROSA|nr:hypothetical protein FNV43_RR27359 [Rhamnella rubrinervis]
MAGWGFDGEEEKKGKRGRACVVVLGDIGRSPRMQYHALSLARQASLAVDIVGYGGSEPYSAILEHHSINIYKMKQCPKFLQHLPWIFKPFVLLFKAVFQFFMLLWFLCYKIPAPDVFLVQNPPSVPTLVAVKWASWLRGSAFIIDWHNFGYTLLALSLGRSSRFVAVYRWFERHYGKMADGSLCVTRAMQHELAQNWGIKATVLYDQPPEFFHSASLEEKHKLFCRLNKNLTQPHGVQDCATIGTVGLMNKNLNDTLCTSMVGSDIVLKPNRPAIIVSSTSWTPDEDFGILLEAAVMYDRRVAAILNEDNSTEEVLWKEMWEGKQYLYPRLLFIITGKGPEKEKYEEKIRRLHLIRVAFRTMWLSAEDYPLLLGSADLGVCLHTSSSGLDLPMKVVDMFGCGLPVCAVSYSCIKELVQVEKNGVLFSSSSELADELLHFFKGFPDACDSLELLRNGALETGSSARWTAEWEDNAQPLISKAIKAKTSEKIKSGLQLAAIPPSTAEEVVPSVNPSIEVPRRFNDVPNTSNPQRATKLRKYVVDANSQVDSIKLTNYENLSNVVDVIRRKLGDDGVKAFKNTSFGHFLDMKSMIFCSGIVHSFLVRVLECDDPDVLVFNFWGIGARFDCNAFNLVTGLKFSKFPSFFKMHDLPSTLWDKYFGGRGTIEQNEFMITFEMYPFDETEVNVKVCMFYLLEAVLLVGDKRKSEKKEAYITSFFKSIAYSSYDGPPSVVEDVDDITVDPSLEQVQPDRRTPTMIASTKDKICSKFIHKVKPWLRRKNTRTKAEFKFVEESLEGALFRTPEDPLYPRRRSLRRSQAPVERNRLKDIVVHRPRINKTLTCVVPNKLGLVRLRSEIGGEFSVRVKNYVLSGKWVNWRLKGCTPDEAKGRVHLSLAEAGPCVLIDWLVRHADKAR